MSEFFSLEGPLITALDKCGRVVLLSVLWVVCSLPVFTLGASSSAFYYGIVKTIRRERSSTGREFFKCFKRCFKMSVPFALAYVLISAVLFIDIYVWYAKSTKMSMIYMDLCIVLLLMLIMIAIYTFPVMSRFKLTIKEMFKFSAFIAFKHLPYSVGCVFIFGLMVFIISLLPISIIFIPGVACIGMSYLIEGVLKKYIPEPGEGEENWYDE